MGEGVHEMGRRRKAKPSSPAERPRYEEPAADLEAAYAEAALAEAVVAEAQTPVRMEALHTSDIVIGAHETAEAEAAPELELDAAVGHVPLELGTPARAGVR